MMQKSVHTATSAGTVGQITMAECGASVVRRENTMNGQISLFDYRPQDKTKDRNESERVTPNWYQYERCENCQRWARYQIGEQPPCGWGIYGFCNEHKQRTEKTSYCMQFDDKNRM